ncbi:MAG: hypothetical protein ACYTGW_14920 [Planctomycetota bacterium]|jgi:hypothetical protein
MKSTIRAGTATWLVFASVLLLGLTPLWAGEPEGNTGTTGKQGSTLPKASGSGEGWVNVPSMAQETSGQAGEIGSNGYRVIAQMRLTGEGVTLALPSDVSQAVATYTFQNVLVTATVQEGTLHFGSASLEMMRLAGVEHVDITLAASPTQYLRVRIELPFESDQVTVNIE